MSNYGKTIKIFLPDGVPTGVIMAEIGQWTGQIIVIPRTRLADYIKHEAVVKTGVYILQGNEEDLKKIYIGESDNVANRLSQHATSKEFWESACIITSKDLNLTKAHARYLEYALINLASKSGLAEIQNSQMGAPVTLAHSDIADMNFFIDQIKLVLPLVGFDFIKSTPQKSKADLEKNVTFVMTSSEYRAMGIQLDSGEFVVLAGAIARFRTVPSFHGTSYFKLRESLIANQILVQINDAEYSLTQDFYFKSPSAAASVVAGRASNGFSRWKKDDTGETYGDWQQKLVAGK